jgi:hypothetical protein
MANQFNFQVGQIYHIPKFGTIKITSQCGKNTYNVVDCDLDGNALGATLRETTKWRLIYYILVTPENRAALAACITRDLELEKVISNLWVQYRNESDKDNKDSLMRQIKQYQAL